MSQPCPVREHVPDRLGICRVCGRECFRPCPHETPEDYNEEYGERLLCRLYAGHEEDCDFGLDDPVEPERLDETATKKGRP